MKKILTFFCLISFFVALSALGNGPTPTAQQADPPPPPPEELSGGGLTCVVPGHKLYDVFGTYKGCALGGSGCTFTIPCS